jgi:carboxyl-terminal processing protease
MILIRKQLFPVLLTLILSASPIMAQPADGPSRGGGSVSTDQQLSDEELQKRMELIRSIRENVGLFGEIYRQVNTRYVDYINPEGFLKAGIDGMLATLDPYTEYIEPENTDDLRIMSTGRYGGVGMQIGTRGPDRILTVISPIEGTPAWRLGLRAGDQIVEIDGERTEGFTSSEAADRLRGPQGTDVTIKVRRQGVDKLLNYTITRELIQVRDVSYAGIIEPGIGYIRLTRFSREAGEEVHDAIEELMAQGLEGLILDLRSNPGGLLPEALAVAENFTDPGDMIVSTRGREPDDIVEFRSEEQPTLPDRVPLVILMNQGSASASEIVAGAVQDLDRGVIIGKTSFGKGLVQSVINFKDGTALRVTTAKYYTPSGRLIQKVDYFSENESVLHESENADEDSVFTTSKGRSVRAHGGIEPDLEVEMPEVGELTLALWREDTFFDFANKYVGGHDMQSWEVTDEIFSAFRQHLDETGFVFQSEMVHDLNALREQAVADGYDEEVLAKLDALINAAKSADEAKFGTEEQDLRLRLRVEIASVMAGNAGRTQAFLEHDDQVLEAIRVLQQQERYASALAGEEQ